MDEAITTARILTAIIDKKIYVVINPDYIFAYRNNGELPVVPKLLEVRESIGNHLLGGKYYVYEILLRKVLAPQTQEGSKR